jgi:hypothetical protein
VAVITSGRDERDERKRTSEDASKRTWTTSKPESSPCSGISVEDTCLLTTRCPVFRRRDSHLGFRMELETLAGHAKGKGTSGRPARPKVPMGQSGADRPIVVMKRGNARGAKGVGHSRRCWVNGRPEEPSSFAGRRQPSLSGTSRMRRESQVRLCVQRMLACSAGERPAGVRVRSPVVWIAGWRETKTLKPIDNVSLGKTTSHRAVTKVNALWPRK